MKIMGEVDGSVLWILQQTPALAANLRKEAARFGIGVSETILITDTGIERLTKSPKAPVYI